MKTSSWLIVCGLVCAGFLFAEGGRGEAGTVKGDRVNVRARPNATAEICCQMNRGDAVSVLERRLAPGIGTNMEEWVRVVLPEKATVWVQSTFVREEGEITTKVNGRAGPGLNWPVLCLFAKGDHVTVRTNVVDWTGIVPPPTASAWIFGRYVEQAAGEAPPDAPKAEPE